MTSSRQRDWIRQSERDIEAANRALDVGLFEWVAFASQQAAEKAVKGLLRLLGRSIAGHSTSELVKSFPELIRSERLRELCLVLDEQDLFSRYPDKYKTGAPCDHYNEEKAGFHLKAASRIVDFCKKIVDHLESEMTNAVQDAHSLLS